MAVAYFNDQIAGSVIRILLFSVSAESLSTETETIGRKKSVGDFRKSAYFKYYIQAISI